MKQKLTMFFKGLLIMGLLFLNNLLKAQVVLKADGSDDAYQQISRVLGGDACEVPDCAHHVKHITETFDKQLGEYVFVFHSHAKEDNDRCRNYDRERVEIKTYGPSAAKLKGEQGETVVYKWKFKIDSAFKAQPTFTHIHQIKAGDGDAGAAVRPVTSAIVDNGKDWATLDSLMAAHDIGGYNYHLWSATADHKRVPSRMIVQTESYPKDAFANWKLVKNNDYVLGDFVWTAMDYLGESGIGRWYYSGDVPGEHWEHDFFPWHGAYCGDIDLIGWRKPISHYRSLLYNNTEKLYMAVREPEPNPLEIKTTWWSVWPTWESWTWPEYLGKPLKVEVYSKYPRVRLYLNDKLIGEKPTTEEQEHKAEFIVPYSPGMLKAIGVDNNKEIESTVLQTSGEAAKIKLTADRKEIIANGQDLSFVTIEITDKDGIPQPNAVNRLHFKIDGAGIIAGVANADMKDTDPYVGNTHKAWHGRALVIIKSTHDTGDFKLTVSSAGLSGATLNIKAISDKNK